MLKKERQKGERRLLKKVAKLKQKRGWLLYKSANVLTVYLQNGRA